MARPAFVPPALTIGPFRAADTITTGLLSRKSLRSTAWRRLYHGVYADATLPVDHRLLCQAAGLLLPAGSAVGLLSAAHLWDVRGLDPGPAVTVVCGSAHPRHQDHLVVRRMRLGPEDTTTLFGIPVTTPVRTAFDLARFLPRVDAVVALDAMLHQSKLSPHALLTLIESYAWWPGISQARDAFSPADRRAESPMESRMRLVIVDSDLPAPARAALRRS